MKKSYILLIILIVNLVFILYQLILNKDHYTNYNRCVVNIEISVSNYEPSITNLAVIEVDKFLKRVKKINKKNISFNDSRFEYIWNIKELNLVKENVCKENYKNFKNEIKDLNIEINKKLFSLVEIIKGIGDIGLEEANLINYILNYKFKVELNNLSYNITDDILKPYLDSFIILLYINLFMLLIYFIFLKFLIRIIKVTKLGKIKII